MAEHTPTPWCFEPHNGFGGKDFDGEPWPFGYISTSPTPQPIFELRPLLVFKPGELRANAAFIIRAVNNFDDLVRALENVIRVADRKTDEFDAARADLAKAKGEPNG